MSRRVPGAAASALAGAGLGVARVVFFVLCSLGPLLVVAGVVPTAFAATGLTAVAGAFLALGVVLGVFTAGYVAMARRVRNAGAFYALIAAGLGKSWGLAGWLVALVAYSLLQVGLYGIFGPQAASFATDNLHLTHPWWVYALGAWLLVAALGLVRANLSSRILGALLVCELVVILALDISGLTHPGPGGFSLTTLSPARLVSHGGGALLAIAVLGFVGFEQAPVYGEEARDPRRTVARATYACLALATAVYVLTPVAMAVHYGSGNLVTVAQAQGPGMLLGLNSGLFGHAGRLLFLTSVLAAAVAFHNAVWRYLFSPSREGVLFAWVGRTGRAGVARAASAVQSAIGLTVIVLFAAAGWDPTVQLFFWLGTTGGFGVLILMTVTCLAVLRYFARHPDGASRWQRTIAPGLAGLALTAIVALCAVNYSTLIGVPAGSLSAKLLPSLYAAAAVAGLVWGWLLKRLRPGVYANIGLGVTTDTAAAVQAAGLLAAGESAR